MPSKVTISKKVDKSTVVVVEAESNQNAQVAMKEALDAINLAKVSKNTFRK